MGCGCGGKKREPAKIQEPKTSGAWKLVAPNGDETFYDVKVQAQAENLRTHGGKGTVLRGK